MKLELYDSDLRPEHKMCSPSLTAFDKFLPVVQQAITAVGKATYFSSDRSNYNVIYPPIDKQNATQDGSHATETISELLNGILSKKHELPLTIWIDPGTASVESLQKILTALSDLHRAYGGKGLIYQVAPEKDLGRLHALKMSLIT